MTAETLGPCCRCRGTTDVRSIVFLPFRAPEPGLGCWGCLECGLPLAGAIAVLCDRCTVDVQERNASIEYVCIGDPREARRARWPDEDPEPFDHDLTKHPEVLHPC